MTALPETPYEGPRRSSPLSAVRRVWPMAVVLTAFGLVAGLGYGSTRQVSYNAEARVGVGTGSLSASAVAGYTIGVEDIAADYARSVTTADAVSTLRRTLGDRADGVLAANASPVPDSAVIRVDVEATSEALALQAVTATTASFVQSINAQVTNQSPASVLAAYQALESRVVNAQSLQSADQTALVAARAARGTAASVAAKVAAAQAKLDRDTVSLNSLTTQASALQLQYQTLVSTPAAENGLRNVQSAYLVSSNKRSLFERYGLLGLAAGVLLSVVAAVGLDARRVRRQVRAGAAAPLVPAPAATGAAARWSRRSAGARRLPPTAPVLRPASPPAGTSPATLATDPYLREALRSALDQQAAGTPGQSPPDTAPAAPFFDEHTDPGTPKTTEDIATTVRALFGLDAAPEPAPESPPESGPAPLDDHAEPVVAPPTETPSRPAARSARPRPRRGRSGSRVPRRAS